MPNLEYQKFQRVFPEITVDVDLSLSEGVNGILGKHGCGKSTLARAAVGLEYALSGGVKVCGCSPNERTKAVTAYFPEGSFLSPKSTVKKEMGLFGAFPDFSPERARSHLNAFQIDENAKISALSAIEQRFVCLSFVLARDAKVYLLDEAPLSSELSRKVFEDFLSREGRGKCVVLFSSDVFGCAPYLDRAVILKFGRIVWDGAPHELVGLGRSLLDYYNEVTQ